jgi:hypothetical protein
MEILVPVCITMVLVILVVKFVTFPYTSAAALAMVYQEGESDTGVMKYIFHSSSYHIFHLYLLTHLIYIFLLFSLWIWYWDHEVYISFFILSCLLIHLIIYFILQLIYIFHFILFSIIYFILLIISPHFIFIVHLILG